MSSKYFSLFFFIFFVFQNCGKFETVESRSAGLYGYSDKPTYFADVKLIETSENNSSINVYKFDFVAASAVQPGETLNYDLKAFDSGGNLVCFTQGTLEAGKGHKHFNCSSPFPQALDLELVIVGGNSIEQTYSYRF